MNLGYVFWKDATLVPFLIVAAHGGGGRDGAALKIKNTTGTLHFIIFHALFLSGILNLAHTTWYVMAILLVF